jgi:hypothetical protein
VQVVQDGLLQGGVGLDRGDQNDEVSLKLVYQICNYGVVLGDVSFKYLEVVGDKVAKLVEGDERGLNVVG